MLVNWKNAQQKAARTARWAVTMAKVRIRRVASRTRWQLVTFYGKSGAESVGVVDMLAVRKDHSKPMGAAKRGGRLANHPHPSQRGQCCDANSGRRDAVARSR